MAKLEKGLLTSTKELFFCVGLFFLVFSVISSDSLTDIANPKSGSIFRIVFSIINYPKLTETQKNEQLNYTVTVTDIGGVSVVPSQAIDGPVSGRIISSKGTLSSSGIMYHYFTYTCQTTDVNTFLFTIGNSSTTLTLNNI